MSLDMTWTRNMDDVFFFLFEWGGGFPLPRWLEGPVSWLQSPKMDCWRESSRPFLPHFGPRPTPHARYAPADSCGAQGAVGHFPEACDRCGAAGLSSAASVLLRAIAGGPCGAAAQWDHWALGGFPRCGFRVGSMGSGGKVIVKIGKV